MKARCVYESLDFERGVDPKNAMGIGLLGKDMKNMSREEQEEYIISCLPILFPNGFKGLVSHDGENWLNPDATGIISDFLSVKKIHPYISPYQLVANYLVSKAMKIKESVNFERGQDPKAAMGIGMGVYKDIEDIMEYLVILHEGSYEMEINDLDIIGFYKNKLFTSGGRSIIYNIVSRKWKMDWPGSPKPFSIKHPDEFINEVDTDLTRRKKEIKKLGYNPYVNEGVNFERGLDPKTAMGIGDKEAQAIKKLGKFAKKHKFVKAPFDEYDYEEGIINIAKWERPKKLWSDEPIQVQLYKDSGYQELLIYFTDINGQSGSDSVEDWMNDEIWRRHAEDY